MEPTRFKPLDPGRIDLVDPLEIDYWCADLHCDEAALRAAVAAVGTHVSAVREHLASAVPSGR